jgi:hypothetical protein
VCAGTRECYFVVSATQAWTSTSFLGEC